MKTRLQEAQSRRNAASKDIGKAKGAKDEALAAKLMAEVADLKDTIAKGEDEERVKQGSSMLRSPSSRTCRARRYPLGKDEHDNKEVRKVGAVPKFDFSPKQHFELGEALGLMDFEGAAKISGARFVVLKGALARLERAIASLMLDLHTAPAKVRSAATRNTTRRCWSRIRRRTEREICRSLRRICSGLHANIRDEYRS